MYDYLSKLFNKNVEKTEIDVTGLPIYMKGYVYEPIVLYGKKIVFMRPNRLDINAYKSHSRIISKKFGCETVLVLSKSKEGQRNNLINNGIMFAEENKFLFMPYLGLDFNDSKKDYEINDTELTYNDFLVSLVFVYKNNYIFSSKDIIDVIKTNKMTVLRAICKLESLKLIEKITYSKEYKYRLIVDKKTYIDSILKIMKSPIRETRIINSEYLPTTAVFSGISALSKKTMLLDDVIETYAIYKKEYDNIKEKTLDYFDGAIIEKGFVKLEIWNYNPNIFSKNGCAELISVIRTIDENDERVLGAIEDLKEELLNEQCC